MDIELYAVRSAGDGALEGRQGAFRRVLHISAAGDDQRLPHDCPSLVTPIIAQRRARIRQNLRSAFIRGDPRTGRGLPDAHDLSLGHPHQVGRRQSEDGVGRAGGRPNLLVAEQILINE